MNGFVGRRVHWPLCGFLIFLGMGLGAMVPAARSADAPAAATAPAALLTMELWPEGKMPGKGAAAAETERPPRGDNVRMVTNVSRPTVAVFPAAKGKTTAPAMVVCPGGAYSFVAMDLEGTEIASWLNSAGITAVVLKYRVPGNRDGAFQDVQRALSLVRAHAAEWNVDPKRLGVLGFSAGGHLAAKASTGFDERSYARIDAVDDESCRPDFAVLVYPAYLDKDGKVAPELNLKARIPPTLIVHNEDDPRFVPGSKLYDAALTEAKAPHKFVLYATGGHGYGLRCTKDARAWPGAALEWLHTVGIR